MTALECLEFSVFDPVRVSLKENILKEMKLRRQSGIDCKILLDIDE